MFIRWWLRGKKISYSWSSQTVCSCGAFQSCGGWNSSLFLKQNCFSHMCCRWLFTHRWFFPLFLASAWLETRVRCAEAMPACSNSRVGQGLSLFPTKLSLMQSTNTQMECGFWSSFPFCFFLLSQCKKLLSFYSLLWAKHGGDTHWLFLCLTRIALNFLHLTCHQ